MRPPWPAAWAGFFSTILNGFGIKMTIENSADFKQGLATRKQVMGEDFVANAFGNATDFTLPMQHYITKNAWGDVW
jgi:hypothetical protein